ncbi:flippase-like domain-containing protein [Corynebacterium sp. zg254]|uniref:UPF0104 family protein n=1 Tax=Corynebacterium zhongnanshanii TaxID=2768834 RepID=A0ABQ6VCN6_9CORY|nr:MULTISPECIES: YbhN family protein [Corynebacterium]KAB3519990.1 UPF0104 family protein [Corynebacterium zhongnanshanii]MCR5914940.1 flippase-like domain-containing protein [Corynebacterium sp. zg254]
MSKFYRTPGFRAIAMLVVLGAIAFFGREHLSFISDGWNELSQGNNTWIALAAVAIALSMVAQAEVMVVLLRSADVPAGRWRSNMLGLAANAWSATFPGGPAISAAMIFREQLKWGATPVIASWYMILSGALSGAGMAILAVGAVFFLGLKVSWVTIAVAVGALVAIALATNWIALHPRSVEAFLINRARAFNRLMKKPEDRFTEHLAGMSEQIAAVELPLPRLAMAITASLMNWVLEIIALLFCVVAVGAEAPVAGVVLSFLAAKLVGQVQVTPGGLGTVDLALTSSLVAMGTLTIHQAFATAIVFRMLSFIGLALVGWIVYFAGQFNKMGDDPTTAPVDSEAGRRLT